MRVRTRWRLDLVKELTAALGQREEAHRVAVAITEVELALVLLERIAPAATVDSGWTVLNGYPVAQACGVSVDVDDLQAIGVARHRLTGVKGPYDWMQALARYERDAGDLRGFTIDSDRRFRRRQVTKVTRRWDDYTRALAATPAHERDALRPAEHGEYILDSGHHRGSVRIPRWMPLPAPVAGHNLSLRTDRGPLTVTKDELVLAARDMDDAEHRTGAAGQDSETWESRISRVILDVRQHDQTFATHDEFTVAGLLHMAGMLSVGKTTLVTVLAWHLTVDRRQRVTVVLGDVTAALRMVELFNRLIEAGHAAPIVGESNRRGHAERLHRLDARGGASPLRPRDRDPGFGWVSTACGLDGLRTDSALPWPVEQAPCRSLRRAQSPDSPKSREGTRGCPFWSSCQRHAGARGLTTARVWVATTASLVHTRVPRELNPERMRYLEAVWRTSDLIMIDEADQVQAQLDSIFSPSQTLIGPHESWLMDLWDQVDRELRRSQLAQVQDGAVLAWVSSLNLVRITTILLYNLLTGRWGRYLRTWMGEDYFTGWTLASKLAEDWVPRLVEPDEAAESLLAAADEQSLRAAFDRFLDDPVRVRAEHASHAAYVALVELVKTLHLPDERTRREEFRAWVRRIPMKPAARSGTSRTTRRSEPPTTDADLEDDESRDALCLELFVVTTVLAHQLDRVIELWRTVEGRLDLRGISPLMFHRPPQDFIPVVPDSPMGNVLGFRYRPSDRDTATQNGEERGGQLSFFRYAGVGRAVLLSLHDLFHADGGPGPNVLLLSGTSWAHNSPRYHIDHPVDVVLRAPSKEVEAISRSRFYLLPLYRRDNPDQPYTISGISNRDDRRRNLQGMTRALVTPRLGTSRLDAALDQVDEPDRRRALVLVGSYDEAKLVADTIVQTRSDLHDQVRYLVPDDREFGGDWLTPDAATALPRGEVETLYASGARVLVAPLLAMERGHNILTDDHRAALGAAFFLVRPHPRPDDLDYVTQTVNAWAIHQIRHNLPAVEDDQRSDLASCARAFRHKAQGVWRTWLRRPLAYSALTGADKDGMTWSQLVGIWQVIGRLVRGGCPAAVYFCDAKFAPARMGLHTSEDDTAVSLLTGMSTVLAPYFDGADDHPDTHLVRLLYRPLYEALSRLENAPL